ncbi:hypothetical protein ACEXQE_10595 [Herbiconiux sp. P17]|uniref:hypothetical protein n=1 Tax=Herbiconiux wuyangfengii TaxID=3342794 RepID=UPI0035B752FD
MPEQIADAFLAFGEAVRPSAADVDASTQLRNRIADSVATESRVLRMVDTGSFVHGTAVRGGSLFDVVVVLRGAKPKSLARSLELLHAVIPVDALSAAAIRDDSLVIEHLGSPGVRLIPAYEASGDPGDTADSLWVPDAGHRWVRHRPAARTVLLSRIDDDGSVSTLIRLLLAWKHRQGVAVSSYYLETVAIRQALQQRSFSLLWDLCWIWERLSTDALAPVPDLTSPSQTQPVRACVTLARAIEAQFPIERAASSARGAIGRYMDGDLDATEAYLRALFGDDFPEL